MSAAARLLASKERDGVASVSWHEVARCAHTLRLGTLADRRLEIRCYDLEATPFREMIDLFLHLKRHPGWVWVDEQGRSAPGRGIITATAALGREALTVPLRYARHRLRVRSLRVQPELEPRTAPFERALFVRSDHDFGLVAGGSVGHLAGVIRGLRNAALDVQVVSTDWLVDVPREAGFHLARPIYRPIRNVAEMPMLDYNAQLEALLTARWAEWRPDFVYQRYSLHNYIGPVLRRRFGVPFVCEYNGSFPWMVRNWEKSRLRFEALAEDVELLNLRVADLVVVVSQNMADEVVARGIDAGKVLVNPNGVNTEVYSPAVSGAEVRRRYGLDGKLVVGFIGTFGPWHGAEKLVEAAAWLRETHGDAAARLHFLLIGDGLRMPEVRAAVAAQRLEPWITLTGRVPQEQGPQHLAACDVLASPHVPNPDGTPFFGSPTKLFEYMAMGRAIVASELDQIGEVLEDGETALLVPPGDAAALGGALARLAAEPALRGRLGAAAREAAVRRHTWDEHCRRILRALAERVGAEAGV